MSKVLKVLSVVAAVALAIPSGGTSLFVAGAASLGVTLSAAAATAITIGLSVGASLLAKRPKLPANSPENANRLRASIDPRTPRKTAVGITALATDIRDEEFTGANQEYLHRFIVCASHVCESIDEIWFDDKLAWQLSTGVQSDFGGYLTVEPVPAGDTAYNISARMGGTRKFTGLANVHITYKRTGNSKKAESPFAQSITSRITIKGKGARLYDPRLDSTVAGGSGAHRADDQTTWTWNDDACRNPALQLLFYLLGWKINGELAVGKAIPPARIDLESFAVAANICDETLTIGAGPASEPRYRSDGVWSEGDSPTTVIDMLKASMNADLDDVDGKLRLTVFQDDTAISDADFTADDVLGEFEWTPASALHDTFNIVSGSYTDPSNEALYQQVDYPRVEVASPDGIDRIEQVNLPMVQSVTQAQRLAALRLARQQNSGEFRAEFQATAWRVQKNSIVRLTFAPMGFVNKIFRVAEIDLRTDGIVPLVLREEDPSLYTAPAFTPAVEAVAGTPHDPFKDPVIDVLAAVSVKIRGAVVKNPRTIADAPRALLTATDAGATATISVARHDWDYPDIAADVTRELGTITGLAFGTAYYVYFDDATLADGAPTYHATTDGGAALNSSDWPDRHPLGSIITPADGAADTEGGSTPGYGYPGEASVPAWIVTAATNFNSDNDGNALVPPAATGLSLVSSATVAGGARIVASWAFTPSTDPAAAANIDGQFVGLFSAPTSAAWTYASTDAIEWQDIRPGVTTATWNAQAFEKHHWLVVIPYRVVRNAIDPDGIILGTIAQTAAAHQPGSTPNFTGNVGGTPSTLVALSVTASNARNSLSPDAPALSGTAYTTATFDSGNVTIAQNFTFTRSSDPANKNCVDLFEVGTYHRATSGSYTWGSDAANERWETVTTNGMGPSFAWNFAPDVAANRYWHCNVRVARKVDTDIDGSGWKRSALAAASTTGFRPAATQNFSGNVGGTAASTIATVTTNFNADAAGNALTPDAATSLSLSSLVYSNSTAAVVGTYAFTPSTTPANKNWITGYLVGLYHRSTTTTWTYDPSFDNAIRWVYVEPGTKSVTWNGVPAYHYYWLVVIPVRRVRTDVSTSGLVAAAAAQTTAAGGLQPATGSNFTGSIDSYSASLVAIGSNRANSGLNSDGTVATDKVLADSIIADAINLQDYAAQSGLVGFGTSDSFSGSMGPAIAVDSAGVLIARFVPTWRLTKTGPVEGTTYSMTFEIYVEKGGVYTYSDAYTVKERWDSPSTGSTVTMEQRVGVIEHRFTGLAAGSYLVGYRATTPSTNGAEMPAYRYMNKRVPKADG